MTAAFTAQNFQLASADDIPSEAYVTGFVGHPQQHMLTCEIRSATDVANFWGLTISEDELFKMLPSSTNPEVGFVGNPNDAWGNIPPYSYGVHATPIAKALRELGLEAKKGHNLEWDVLRREVAAGHPVIVWIIGAMWVVDPIQYFPEDGSQTTTARYEHTMVLTGYTVDTVQVVDAYSGVTQNYALQTFLDSWAVLGNQAVLVVGANCEDCKKSEPEEVPTPTPAAPDDPNAYTVKPGEYLIQLGRRFGVDWRELARINGISYPWALYPGQKLKLK